MFTTLMASSPERRPWSMSAWGGASAVVHVLLVGGVLWFTSRPTGPTDRVPEEQITYIVEGSLRFWIGEDESQELVVSAGEVLHIPSNVWHKAEALEDTLDVDVFSPPRQDWLDKTDAYLRK